MVGLVTWLDGRMAACLRACLTVSALNNSPACLLALSVYVPARQGVGRNTCVNGGCPPDERATQGASISLGDKQRA